MQATTLQLIQHNQHILIIRFNRPESRNAISSVMMRELRDLWQSFLTDQKNLRCLILTGNPPAFCAGADLKERKDLDLETWRLQHVVLEEAMLAMVECPLPLIAAVNGAAFGGGLELALACDFIYADTNAFFSQSEVKVGLMPGAMGTQNLPRACGLRRAKELTFTAESFTVQEAFDWGIVNRILTPDTLLSEAVKTAETIAKNAPLAVKQAKKALNASQGMDIQSGFHFEIEVYNTLLTSKDRQEGIRAFNEKRSPNFLGE